MGSRSVTIQFQSDGTAEPFDIAVVRTGTPQSLARSQLQQQQRVLCVEGNSEAASALRQVLGGYELVFASSAYEALRRLNSRAFDLYVLEYWLNDWSGVSLCRDIRKVDSHVPVCFCTAAAQPEHRQRAKRAGASAYFLKRANPERLNAEISMLMQSSARRNEESLRAALVAVEQELKRRFAALPDGASSDEVEKALKRNARTKARNVFLEAGGTLAAFERGWEPLWSDAWAAARQ